MTISRPLWVSQRGGGGGGDSAGEVVITEDQQIPSITASLGYVGENDDPVVTLTITDPATDADELRLYRSTSTIDPSALPSPIETLTPSTISDDDAAVSIGITYHYRISSVTGGLVRLSPEVTVEVTENTGPDFTNAQVGDEIGGGIYAGTHTDGTNTWHVIFAKQAGESAVGPEWGNYATTTGATNPDDGLANQTDILTNHDDGSADAFYHCRDYVDAEGNNDYYLPARNELALVDALVSTSHAEFSTDLSAYRWSSTENSSSGAWSRRFSDGAESNLGKSNTARRVRPVRRVAV